MILHVINGEHFAGAERVQDILAQELPALGFPVEFVALKEGDFDRKRVSRVPLTTVPMRTKFDLVALRKIESLARQKNCTLIHCHTPRSGLVGAWVSRRLAIPLVYHVHSPAAHDTESVLRNAVNSAVERLLIFPATRHFIAVSRSLKSYLSGCGVADRLITVVPNGVPAPVGSPLSFMREEPVKEYVIGMAALFRPRKGVEVLIDALARLRAGGIRVRFRAIGKFETAAYEHQVKAAAEKLGVADQIEWLGFCSNVYGELQKLHLFVLPSLYGEGMPMVVLEALATGLPVIASNVEGIPEVVIPDVGKVVPPDSAQALADAIASFVCGDADLKAMAIAAQAHHRAHYSAEAMAGAVARCYRVALRRD